MSNSHNNTAQFQESLRNCQKFDEPYRHYILNNLISEKLRKELVDLPFEAKELDYKLGTREEFNNAREYINQEAISKYSSAKEFADIFLSRDTISLIEEKENISLKGSSLRIEYAIDNGNFWLKPHTDLGVKLFTMLFYISEGPNASGWGTDIYENADIHHATIPYETNSALVFYPTDKTWHGFKQREIVGVRKTLIVNYVTDEWRNRHELVDDVNPVY